MIFLNLLLSKQSYRVIIKKAPETEISLRDETFRFAVPPRLSASADLSVRLYKAIAMVTGRPEYPTATSDIQFGNELSPSLRADSHQPSVLCTVIKATDSVITFENMDVLYYTLSNLSRVFFDLINFLFNFSLTNPNPL